MSGLRQLMAGLWGAVWLWARLLGLRARRLFGGGPAVGDGPDFHRAGVDAPVEGVDYEPRDLPPELLTRLETMRGELLAHARETATAPSRRVRRRRTVSIAMASLLAFGVVGAGASALVTGSTGVPSVDRLLGIYESVGESTSRDAGGAVAPRPGATATSVEAPLGQSGRRVVSTAYLGPNEDVCLAATRTDDARQEGLGSVRCFNAASLNRLLAQNGGAWAVAADEAVVIHGVVRGDITNLTGRGPNGALKTYLGDAWASGLPDAESMRPFIAIGDADIGTMPRAEAFDRLTDRAEYVLEGDFEDGGSIVIAP